MTEEEDEEEEEGSTAAAVLLVVALLAEAASSTTSLRHPLRKGVISKSSKWGKEGKDLDISHLVIEHTRTHTHTQTGVWTHTSSYTRKH